MMKVYITNDDGIEASGLRALGRVVRSRGYDLTVVAPHGNHSGKSQSITFDRPLTAMPYSMDGDVEAYRVSGTPADCVRLMMAGAFGEVPDIILSGVNHGANLGPDVYLSGTVGAARQAALSRIPAIAWSTDDVVDEDALIELLAQYLEPVVAMALSNPGTLYNVNFPEVGGASSALTKVSDPWYRERVTLVGPSEVILTREVREDSIGAGSDVACVRSGMTSISPIVVAAAVDRRFAMQAVEEAIKIG